ncbi:MAG: tetratricopeptide repeat protein [Anaerolineales bacterium]|jgi:tetratricopeptide (TPR) repeat protein
MAGREDIYQDAMNKGHSAAWDQRWELAADFYRQAVEEMPDRPQAINNLGLAFYQLQRFEEAQGCYSRAAKFSPDDPLPIEKLAEIYERIGKIDVAVEQSMLAADLYLRIKDADKAIENWVRVTSLIPEHLKAHSRLALVHERLGRKSQAIHEYIAVAALLQDIGQIEEAVKAVEQAASLDPTNKEARQALELVKSNKTLPKPVRQRGSTGPLRMAAVREMSQIPPEAVKIGQTAPDPIAEGRQKALTALAGLLFDFPSGEGMDEDESTVQRGLRGVFSKGKGSDIGKITKHIGAAIDSQTRAEDETAAKELKKAIDEGLDFPAANFNLGLLYHKLDRKESAVRNLQRSINHPDFALAARLLIGEYCLESERYEDAVLEYLEALKEADSAVIPPEQAMSIREQYESVVESVLQEGDEERYKMLSASIASLLLKTDWRRHVSDARLQLPGGETGAAPLPLAEILTEAKNTQIVEAMARINQLARDGYLRAAMEEAFILVPFAPTYLPLHIHMGELLLRQERTQDAIAKFTVVAETYAIRGEAKRATDLLQRIVEISPMDRAARNRLIRRLIEQGQVDQAIHEYIKLADVHYRLAQLDIARNTFENALRLAQQTNADPTWSARILKHMADIDMQRLDWRQAMRVYEQLRTLAPDDSDTRASLINLNVRLGQENQAASELDNFLSYLTGKAQENKAVVFLEKLVAESEEAIFARRRLAEFYAQSNRYQESITQWDKVAETMLSMGDNEGAKEAIRAILVLNPPNAEQYRVALQKLN